MRDRTSEIREALDGLKRDEDGNITITAEAFEALVSVASEEGTWTEIQPEDVTVLKESPELLEWFSSQEPRDYNEYEIPDQIYQMLVDLGMKDVIEIFEDEESGKRTAVVSLSHIQLESRSLELAKAVSEVNSLRLSHGSIITSIGDIFPELERRARENCRKQKKDYEAESLDWNGSFLLRWVIGGDAAIDRVAAGGGRKLEFDSDGLVKLRFLQLKTKHLFGTVVEFINLGLFDDYALLENLDEETKQDKTVHNLNDALNWLNLGYVDVQTF